MTLAELILSGKDPASKASPDVTVESLPRPLTMHNVGKQPSGDRMPFSATRQVDMALPDGTYMPFCSDSSVSCQDLSAHCLHCDMLRVLGNPDCIYGEPANYTCRVKSSVQCRVNICPNFPTAKLSLLSEDIISLFRFRDQPLSHSWRHVVTVIKPSRTNIPVSSHHVDKDSILTTQDKGRTARRIMK